MDICNGWSSNTKTSIDSHLSEASSETWKTPHVPCLANTGTVSQNYELSRRFLFPVLLRLFLRSTFPIPPRYTNKSWTVLETLRCAIDGRWIWKRLARWPWVNISSSLPRKLYCSVPDKPLLRNRKVRILEQHGWTYVASRRNWWLNWRWTRSRYIFPPLYYYGIRYVQRIREREMIPGEHSDTLKASSISAVSRDS